MDKAIIRKNVGYFVCLYAGYLEAYYPKAYKRHHTRADHMELLKNKRVVRIRCFAVGTASERN